MNILTLAAHHLRTIAARPHHAAAAAALAAALTVATGLVLHDLPQAHLAAAGMLWPTLVFTGIHATGRGLDQDADGGGLLGTHLLPVTRTTLILSRAAANGVATTTLAALVLVGLRFVLPPDVPLLAPATLLVVTLASIGIATVGTIAAHAATATTARDLVGPTLAIPLVMPLLIGGVHGTTAALSEGLAAATPNITFLAGYDIVLLGATALIADALAGTP